MADDDSLSDAAEDPSSWEPLLVELLRDARNGELIVLRPHSGCCSAIPLDFAPFSNPSRATPLVQGSQIEVGLPLAAFESQQSLREDSVAFALSVPQTGPCNDSGYKLEFGDFS